MILHVDISFFFRFVLNSFLEGSHCDLPTLEVLHGASVKVRITLVFQSFVSSDSSDVYS